jgi:nucleoid-associated protein YgaU
VREAKAEAAGAPALAPAPSSAPATPAPASVPSASADVEKAAPGSPASKIHVLLQTAPEAPPPQASCAVLCCAMLCCASCPCVCCPCVMSLARNLEAVLAMAEPLLLATPSISCGSASIFVSMTRCGCRSTHLGRLSQLQCQWHVLDFGSSHSVLTTMWFWDDSD